MLGVGTQALQAVDDACEAGDCDNPVLSTR
jgi:hypothetical protein